MFYESPKPDDIDTMIADLTGMLAVRRAKLELANWRATQLHSTNSEDSHNVTL